MKKIIVIGGGFAGISFIESLSRYKRKDFEIVLIDRSLNSCFLPLLPDVLGRGINPQYLSLSLENLSARLKFQFINEPVKKVDLDKNLIWTSAGELNYDYLVIASGSETNFYNNENLRLNSYKLDDADDAIKIKEALLSRSYDFYFISGGGYTGIEVATNISSYFKKRSLDGRIILVERAPSILGPLPEWMKDYVLTNLKSLGIDVMTNTFIKEAGSGTINLSDGNSYKNSILIWAAGVKTNDFIQNLNLEKNPQGRINVDEFLKIRDNCFVLGDVSFFKYEGSFLRMAVQFAITQGELTAKNIIRASFNKKPFIYKPLDLGFVIPMANNHSCGTILGINTKGFLPTILHYLMCIYRLKTLKNKLGVIKNLLNGGTK